jgi:hypothetical protein
VDADRARQLGQARDLVLDLGLGTSIRSASSSTTITM